LQNNDLKNLNLRQALSNNHSADKNYNFSLVTSNNPADIKVAEQIKAKWAPLKVNLTIKEYDNVTLKKTIIPQRSYDILLYTLDYGSDPDPYPFWHTFQAGSSGANLSNYSNKQADRLLEDARQSFDSKVRQSDYDQFNKILNNDVPFIKLSQASFFYAVGNDINGVGKIYGFSEADRFLNINQWYIKTKRVKM
jgi:peptide/nickel transport system substrate-binding protein